MGGGDKALPKDEDEEDEECEKDGHVVHGAQHDHQLAAKVGHETDQLEDAQEPESAQDGQTRAAPFSLAIQEALEQLHQTFFL